MAEREDKIVVSPAMAGRLLKLMKEEKENLEEKLLDLEMEIEELENSIKMPVPPLDKKETDFTLTINRVEAAVSKHSGLSHPDLSAIIAVDLNLDKTNKDVMKMVKQRVYAHLYALKKKNRVMSEYVQEQATNVFFPIAQTA